jgi:hypothetical protein
MASRPRLKPVGGRYRAFWRVRVTSPSITPSAFLDALMAAMTCGTIFDRASYSYASKAIGSLSKIYPIIPESVSPASPAAGGGISVPARCQNHAKSAAVIIL